MNRRHVYRHLGFKKVVERFYADRLRLDPVAATTLGEHDYDSLLPESGAEAIDREIADLREMRDAFNSLPERELSVDERLDRASALHTARLQLFMLEDVRRWKMGKDLAVVIGDALLSLGLRDSIPFSDRVEAIIARLTAVPAYLMSGRTLFQSVPALWGEMFIDSTRLVSDFLSGLERAFAGSLPQPMMQKFANAAEGARRALSQHAHWLEYAIMPQASGDWAMDKGAFQAMFSVCRPSFDFSELLEMGTNGIHTSQSKIDAYARNLAGSKNSTAMEARKAAFERIQSQSPNDFSAVLEAYRDAVASGRAWVEMTGFASVPDEEQIDILETPQFLTCMIPYAAYLPPERSAHRQKGTYWVTRPLQNSKMPPYSVIGMAAVREGYPGRHLQLVGRNRHPGIWRALADDVESAEGWADYCEEAVLAQKNEINQINALIHERNNLWRALRMVLNMNLHQKNWTYEQATVFLMENADITRAAAEAEIRRHTYMPGRAIAGFSGKYAILKLKDALQAKYGNACPDRLFHDLIITEGAIPMSLASEFYPQIIESRIAGRRAAHP